MAYRFKEQQMLMEGAVGAVFTIIIAMLVSSVISPILASLSGAVGFAMAIQAFFAAFFLMFALKTHRGRENLPQDIVVILIVLGFASIVTAFVPSMAFSYETTITGIALLLSEVYLGLSLAKLLLRKARF